MRVTESCGVLRFFGVDAMREVRELVQGDDAYWWGYPTWPYYWIDVRPCSAEARRVLLEALAADPDEQGMEYAPGGIQ